VCGKERESSRSKEEKGESVAHGSKSPEC
jgi:hypothetical protein